MTDSSSHIVDISSNKVRNRNSSDLETNTDLECSNEEIADTTNSRKKSSNDITPKTLSDHDLVFVTSSSVSISSSASNQHERLTYRHGNDDHLHNSLPVETHKPGSIEAQNTDNQNRF